MQTKKMADPVISTKQLRVILVVVCCILLIPYLVGCSIERKDSDEYMGNVGVYAGDVIPDENTAKAVATAIMQGIGHNEHERNWVPMMVIYDEKSAVWEVVLGAELTTGGCTIWIQKEDGKVLKVQYGE